MAWGLGLETTTSGDRIADTLPSARVQRTPHRTHTHSFFSLRTLTGLTICLCASKVIPSLVMSFVECSFYTVSSYFPVTHCVIDTAFCFTDATDWDQTLRSGVDRLVIWPIRSLPQVMSPSSASMSVASVRKSTFRPET